MHFGRVPTTHHLVLESQPQPKFLFAAVWKNSRIYIYVLNKTIEFDHFCSEKQLLNMIKFRVHPISIVLLSPWMDN